VEFRQSTPAVVSYKIQVVLTCRELDLSHKRIGIHLFPSMWTTYMFPLLSPDPEFFLKHIVVW